MHLGHAFFSHCMLCIARVSYFAKLTDGVKGTCMKSISRYKNHVVFIIQITSNICLAWSTTVWG